ncbi:MAG TPA: glycosyltransferase [Bordetella sp.]
MRLHIRTDPAQAKKAAQQLTELRPDDYTGWLLLGQTEMQSDNFHAAHKHYTHALELKENDSDVLTRLADVLFHLSQFEQAVERADQVLALKPNDVPTLIIKSNSLNRMYRFDEAADVFVNQLIPLDPREPGIWNNLGTLKRDQGALAESEAAYIRSAQLAKKAKRTDVLMQALSNRLTLLHYMPEKSADDILQAYKEWGVLFKSEGPVQRPRPTDLDPRRKIRVGLYSEGFRQHPVGAMITPALEHLRELGIELYFYSASHVVDPLTQRLKAVADKWTPIVNASDEHFAQVIRDDGIDIMMDLAGHNSGTRMRTMVSGPAPLLVKWVGGLINTTGVQAIDYLITDHVESPLGSDAYYTEKLIRMPDDYICYLPPAHTPDVGPLPALKNGYMTLGCFNNPTKINDVILEKWASLMRALPNSRLYLRSGAYGSEETRRHVFETMQKHGIGPERLRLEGQVNHRELLASYNDVDIALDPWPYSGGLTTCEAMLMGVPVVTLPGPTFAGRHSATHVANAGLPELVAQDWEQYQARVRELAANLDHLSTIRQRLRETLLKSPVCDGPRFARHLAVALRAIWQRYCADKTPAALVFTPEGKPWFEDEDAPMEVVQPDTPPPAPADHEFHFAFQGKIVALDHGGAFTGSPASRGLSRLGSLTTIVIDPASNNLHNQDQFQREQLLQHYHRHIALGDGESATLHTCLDRALSGTLEPLAAGKQLPMMRQSTTVLAQLSIPTTRLDAINGLQQLDWLILDNANDNKKILQGAEGLLPDMLIIHLQVLLIDIFKKQPDLGSLGKLLAKYGFRLLRLDQPHHVSYLPQNTPLAKPPAKSQLMGIDAIFVPDDDRLKALDDNQRLKLAFILHSAYKAPDFAYHVLQQTSDAVANRYLTASGWLKAPSKAAEPAIAASPKASVITAAALLRGKDVPQRAYVGVPVYNEERFIEQTVLSLKRQNADGVGFLISDNGSTDKTLELIRDLAGDDERFQIFQQAQNVGALENFKFVLSHSHSEYFMWLGAHDYLSDNYLASAIACLDDAPDIAMACGVPYGMLENSAPQPVQGAVYDFSAAAPLDRYMKSVAELANCTVLHALLRRQLLDGFDIKRTISWDHVLISSLLWHGRLAFLPQARYFRRYFKARKENVEERIDPKAAALPRSDFYDYYAEDFARLAQPVLPAAEFRKHAKTVQAILQQRFEPAINVADPKTESKK